MRKAWTIRDSVSVKGGEADVLIYEPIDEFFGINAKDLVPAIKALDVKTINLRVNSPGGNVFDGFAIYNALRAHPAKVVTYVDGLAASIASVIAMAGDDRRIAGNGFVMIHQAWGISAGPAPDHRAMADTLEKIDESGILPAYTGATKQPQYKVRDWMASETWFDAEEALAEGFMHTTIEEAAKQSVGASFDLSGFQHVPDAVKAQQRAAAATAGPDPRTLEKALRDAGLSRAAARAVLAKGVRILEAPDADPLRDAADAAFLAAGQRVLSLLTMRT